VLQVRLFKNAHVERWEVRLVSIPKFLRREASLEGDEGEKELKAESLEGRGKSTEQSVESHDDAGDNVINGFDQVVQSNVEIDNNYVHNRDDGEVEQLRNVREDLVEEKSDIAHEIALQVDSVSVEDADLGSDALNNGGDLGNHGNNRVRLHGTQDILELNKNRVQLIVDLGSAALLDGLRSGDEAQGEEDEEESDDAREVHAGRCALVGGEVVLLS